MACELWPKIHVQILVAPRTCCMIPEVQGNWTTGAEGEATPRLCRPDAAPLSGSRALADSLYRDLHAEARVL